MGVSITVSQLSNYISNLVKRDTFLSNITISGEVSNAAKSGGNIFFNLKDESASLKCIIFRNYHDDLVEFIENGRKIEAIGSITTYPQGSSYQLIVRDITPSGEGKLYLDFVKLKNILEKEGLFDQDLKKPIPSIPSKIGLITSLNGAALRDVLNVIKRRFPIVDIYLYTVSVQGITASQEIIDAIEYFNVSSDVEFIVITRGGGSFEDLNEFNNELLVRKIHKSKLPIVSAIGHHIDTTITDYVSDVVAATPTEAAEIITPDLNSLKMDLELRLKKLSELFERNINNELGQLEFIKRELKYRAPYEYLKYKQAELESIGNKLFTSFGNITKEHSNKLESISMKLANYDIGHLFERGYSVITHNNKTANSIIGIEIDDKVTIHMKDGRLTCNVEAKEQL